MVSATHFHVSGSTFAIIDEVTPAGAISTFAIIDEVTPAGAISTMSHTCMVLTQVYCYIP